LVAAHRTPAELHVEFVLKKRLTSKEASRDGTARIAVITSALDTSTFSIVGEIWIDFAIQAADS
jgi:hypothetical protein